MDLTFNSRSIIVELVEEADTHALFDYISYLNNIFKEKEIRSSAKFITDNAFMVEDVETKTNANDIIGNIKPMHLEDFNVPDIKRFVVLHLTCDVEEVIGNE